MRVKSREGMSKSQFNDNLPGGNYIKIGAVLGNVNIIQQNSQKNLMQNQQETSQ